MDEIDTAVQRHVTVTTERATMEEAMAFALGAIEQEMIQHPVVHIHAEPGCDCCDNPASYVVHVSGYA